MSESERPSIIEAIRAFGASSTMIGDNISKIHKTILETKEDVPISTLENTSKMIEDTMSMIGSNSKLITDPEFSVHLKWIGVLILTMFCFIAGLVLSFFTSMGFWHVAFILILYYVMTMGLKLRHVHNETRLNSLHSLYKTVNSQIMMRSLDQELDPDKKSDRYEALKERIIGSGTPKIVTRPKRNKDAPV